MLLNYFSKYRWHTASVILAVAAAVLLTLLIPWELRNFIDRQAYDSQTIFWSLSYFFLLGVGLSLASGWRYFAVVILSEKICHNLKQRLFAHIVNLDSYYFDTNKVDDAIANLITDVDHVKVAVNTIFSLAIRNTALLVGSLIMIALTSPRLALSEIIILPLICLPLWFLGGKVRKLAQKSLSALARANAFVSEIIKSIKLVQAYNNQDYSITKHIRLQQNVFDLQLKSTKVRAVLIAIAGSLIVGNIIILVWIAATAVLNNQMSIGALSQFIIYAVVAAGAFGSLATAWAEISQAAGAIERIKKTLNQSSKTLDMAAIAKASPIKIQPQISSLEFTNVNFTYPQGADNTTLKDISFTVNGGETIALVGPSGAGKSTIFNLLMRFYNVDSGSIAINGIKAWDTDLVSWRNLFAFVPQNPTLLTTSIAENIAFGREINDKDYYQTIKQTARMAGADRFIKELSAGYDSGVGAGGHLLSGGQRQLIALARGLFRQAPILLLDEATSSLDAKSEALIKATLTNIISNKSATALVIAHRLSTVKTADRILVINKGQIVEQGNHDQLIEQNGLYSGLVRLQLK